MKVSRLILLVRSASQEIVRAFRPNQILRMQVNGNPIDDVARGHSFSSWRWPGIYGRGIGGISRSNIG